MTPLPHPAAPRSTRAALTGLALGLLLALAGCDTLPPWMIRQQQARITDYKHFDNAPIAPSAQPLVLPVVPDAHIAWPQALTTEAAEKRIASQDTTALIMVRRGQVVYERYFNGYERESLGTSFSMAKSVVSALLGVAMAEGRILSLDEPITNFLPELRHNDARFALITLRHLLQMRSGIEFDEGYRSPLAEAAKYYLTANIPQQVAKLRIARPPGQAYSYQSGDTQLLAMAVTRATGVPLPQYLQAKLWQPMGAEFDASWSLDSRASGVPRAFCCLNARAIDYARFGLVYLNNGQAAGQQLVPPDWVRQSTAAQLGLPGADDAAQRNIERPGTRFAAFYALQWRRTPAPAVAANPLQPGDDFYAEGYLGQYIYVVPSTQTVIVRLGTGRGGNFWPGWMGQWARLNP
jgi:CubicO group peptidase (beta-lactamase class C family)